MNLNRFAVPALALFLGATGLVTARAYGAQQGPPPPGYGQGYGQDRGGWDAPPGGMSDIQRRGFHDGVEGAQKDFDNHRQPDVNNRDEYRNPNLQRGLREEYREGFRRGYNLAVSHFMGGRGSQMREPERPWDAPPGQFSDIQQRGFRDGIVGAQKDFDNHRRPNVNNRDEYRHPDNVPRGLRKEYREAFRQGYEQGVSHFMGGPDRR